MSNLWKRKSLTTLLADTSDDSHALRRTLGPLSLIALGIGAIIGAGLFVRTANAAAYRAGPSVTLGFILAGIGCAFAGLCYAEFASMIPIAGSAYTYSYATMGELMAWIIGWDLVLEYGIGAATVAIAWSQYLDKLLAFLPGGHRIPWEWWHSPFEHATVNGVAMHGIMNIPALFIVLVLSMLLIRGIKESATVNTIIVIVKVTIVLLIIVLGWSFINPANHTPYIPAPMDVVDNENVHHAFGGFWGITGAAAVVFFAYIGFDAVSTAAQETVKPKRDMPIGILGSLAICTVLYILFAHVLTGLATIDDFRTHGREASVVYAIETYMPGYGWLAKLVTIAILGGFSSVILVMLMGQSRVFFAMSRDGLVPPIFSELHPRYRTPWKSNMVFFVFVGAFAAFLPEDIVGEMTSIGTLFAFVLVCAGVWIMRIRDPNAPREFKTPMVPVVPILGIASNLLMIYSLDWPNWTRLAGWLVVGMIIYFAYGRHHSRLNKAQA
jgi:APA family basic amino acid/polyamine antiporter